MNLILAAKAHALLRGSNHVAGDDVVAVATPILRHRLILNFAAQSEGITIDEVIRQLDQEAASGVRPVHRGNGPRCPELTRTRWPRQAVFD